MCPCDKRAKDSGTLNRRVLIQNTLAGRAERPGQPLLNKASLNGGGPSGRSPSRREGTFTAAVAETAPKRRLVLIGRSGHGQKAEQETRLQSTRNQPAELLRELLQYDMITSNFKHTKGPRSKASS
ncbi:hypothetical protein PCANC_18614 [Puccinia coronata f. sp. avenae]|uniref:Uncharacterized protein n=1 Tax=Puccinia coronata f. sp. avenae TaxID=200324 RepID=A0A2N5UHL7_9BASI|nr:hypothetical protein PCANC_18614 [Puccinia coronata f. sp. avenae]